MGPYSPGTSLRQVFAAKTQCCTQTPGALCPLQVAAAPSPINGKASVVSGERILCGALLLLLPVTALVTLVAPLCFLPRDPTTDLIKNRATRTISLHTASHFHPAENTWTDLRSTSRAVARLFPSLWFVGLGCYSACCSFNTDLVVASTNLGAPRNRRRSESDHRGKAGKLDAFRKGELVLVRW